MPTLDAAEYVTLSAYPLATKAVRLTSLVPLWKVQYRTTEHDLPYVGGTESFPSRLTGLRVALPGGVWGDFDSDGNANANPRAGLAENMDELYDNVLAPVTTGNGTRPMTWVRGDGATWTGSAKVLSFDVREKSPVSIRFTLGLLIPPGRLTAP